MSSGDERDVLEVLKAELDFIEKGGYGRSVRTPWRATSIFQDSMTCLNFSDPNRTHPCSECLLMAFVPPGQRDTRVPCHHIPLTEANDTVDSIERWAHQHELEDAVKSWLRRTIARIEAERAHAAARSTAEKP